MRVLRICVTAALGVIGIASAASAQILTIEDYDGSRASVRIGYGSQTLDLEVSVDTPVIVGLLRVRGSVGYGRWATPWTADGAADPLVTRLAATLIASVPADAHRHVRRYVGLGVSAFLPQGSMDPQRGVRLIAGIEGSSDRWTVGPEVELTLPGHGNRIRGAPAPVALAPMFRFGIAIRRAL